MNAETTKRILVIEDEKPMAHAMQMKLERSGFSATEAHNGETALEELERNTYDLIMCDLIMPKMDGWQFMQELRARNITTPIIVMTNLSQDEDRVKAAELGAQAFIVKSDTPIAEIVELVKKVIV